MALAKMTTKALPWLAMAMLVFAAAALAAKEEEAHIEGYKAPNDSYKSYDAPYGCTQPCKDGRDGMNGLNGRDGAPGKDGLNGLNGEEGKDGKDGADGKDGVDGKDGLNGLNGLNGRDANCANCDPTKWCQGDVIKVESLSTTLNAATPCQNNLVYNPTNNYCHQAGQPNTPSQFTAPLAFSSVRCTSTNTQSNPAKPGYDFQVGGGCYLGCASLSDYQRVMMIAQEMNAGSIGNEFIKKNKAVGTSCQAARIAAGMTGSCFLSSFAYCCQPKVPNPYTCSAASLLGAPEAPQA